MSQTIQEHNDDILNTLGSIDGVTKVYLQPPANVKLVYPCIIITQDVPDTIYADDNPYLAFRNFDLLVIDYDFESPIPRDILRLNNPNFLIRPSRFYVSDNLCHWNYSLTYNKSII